MVAIHHLPLQDRAAGASFESMKTLSKCLLIATTALLFIHTRAWPSLHRTNTKHDANINAAVNCFEPGFFGTRQANTRDCIHAALSLPEGSMPGLFHHLGPDDGYDLPYMDSYESCMVTVSINSGQQDLSTWHRISHVASQIASACSIGAYPQGLTGGNVRVGEAGLIQVTVEKYRPLSRVSANETRSTAVA